MRVLHIFAGLMGLSPGVVALYALKGAKLHRKSGIIFVYAMLTNRLGLTDQQFSPAFAFKEHI